MSGSRWFPWIWMALLISCAPGRSWAEEEEEEIEDEDEDEDEDDGEAEDGKPPRKVRWYILPSVAYDTDDGFGLGARFEIQRLAEGYDPYKASLVIQGYASFRGYHHHRLYLNFPGLGPQGNLRLDLRFAYRAWGNDGYWGIGNGTARERAFTESFDKDDPRRKRYRYKLIQPYGFASLRADMAYPFAAFTALTVQWTGVRTYDGSLLEEQQPVGMDGGFSVQLAGGLLVDTRKPELNPEEGVFAEIAGRISPAWGHAYAFGGPFFSIRAFHPIHRPRVILAWRVMGEYLAGDPPFYELTRWGGSIPILGFGGYETIRGVSFGRWRAPGRALANVEWRIELFRHKLFGPYLRWCIVPFVDVGVTWGADDAGTATAAAPEIPVHPTVGIGIHPVYSDAFAARIDLGIGPDAVEEPDGEIVEEMNWGIYFVFDQMF